MFTPVPRTVHLSWDPTGHVNAIVVGKKKQFLHFASCFWFFFGVLVESAVSFDDDVS